MAMIFTNTITAFAGIDLGDIQKLNSDEYIALANGEKVYYWKNDPTTGQKIYLYETMYPVPQLYNLGEFGSRSMVIGQYQYLDGLNNEGIPNNLNKLASPEGWEVSQRVKMDLWGTEITANDQTSIGGSYISKMGRSYPDPYNYSFKVDTTMVDGTKRIDPTPDPLKQFYYEPTLGLKGNVRYTLGQDFELMYAPFFAVDALSDPENGFDISVKNVQKYPWTKDPSVQKGYITNKYEDLIDTYGNSDISTWQNSQIYELEIFHLFFRYHLAVTENVAPDFKAKLTELTIAEGRNPNDISDRIQTTLEYFSIYSFGGHGFGKMQGTHKSSSGKYWTFSVFTPRQYSPHDLRFGSQWNAETGTNYIGDIEALGHRVREYNPTTKEMGQILNPATDKLQYGKTYLIESFVGMEAIEDSAKVESYHSRITVDQWFKLNGQADELERNENVKGFKIIYDNTDDSVEIDLTQEYTSNIKAFNDLYYQKTLDNTDGIIGFQQIVTIPELDSSNNSVQSIAFYSEISDTYNRYQGDGTPQQNDNLYQNNEQSAVFFDVTEGQPEDFYVAHSQNTSTPSIIADLGLMNAVITEVNGEPYTGQELKPSDEVTIEFFVQRDKNAETVVLFNDLTAYIEEYPDTEKEDLALKVDGDSLYTASYNATGKFENNVPVIKEYKTYNSMSNTYSDWITYSKSSNAGDNVNAGTVIKYELKYTIPTMTEIQNNPAKWNLNVPALYGKSGMEKMNITFEISTLDEADSNKQNNWARVNLTVGKPNVRNMYITEVSIYDENDKLIQTFKNEGSPTTGFFLSEALDASMNYYAVAKVKFEYPYGTTQSNNTNLELHSVPSYNNTPPSDPPMSSLEYRVYSDISSRWNDGDIGVYDPRTITNIKNYNPDTDTLNGLVLPIKTHSEINEFSLWIKIPDAMNASGDNGIIENWDEITISGTVGDTSYKDNAITDIQLFSNAGAEYAEQGDNGYQLLDPTLSYYSMITVERVSGSADSMIDYSPNLLVEYKFKNTTDVFKETLTPYTGSRLKNVGDEIKYRLNGLVSDTNYIYIKAMLETPDANSSNNTRTETWANIYNLHVRDLVISPEKTQMADGEYNRTVEHTFSVVAGFNTNGANHAIDNVPVQIIEESRTLTGDFGSPRVVYSDNVSLNNSNEVQLSGTFSTNYTRNMDKKYTVKINGGETGIQTYQEVIRDDNETYVYTTAFGNDSNLLNCDNLRTSGTWSTEFNRTEYSGGVMKTQTYMRDVYDSDGNKIGEREYISYYCEPWGTPTDYQETATFSEELVLKAMFKSTGMNNYVDIVANPSLAEVRAGEKFDLYFILEYNTDRGNFPWASIFRTRTYIKYDRKGCNKDILSPSSPYTANQYPRLIGNFKISGSQQEPYDMIPYSVSGTYSKKYYYDPFATRHIPSDTKNMDMKFYLQSEEIDGYIYDINNRDSRLKLCETVTIKVVGGTPINVGSQVIE